MELEEKVEYMTLGELKTSLSKFPPDMDDKEIVMICLKNDKVDYQLLGYTAYVTLENDDIPCIVLGTMEAGLYQMKRGKLTYPDGTKPNEDSFKLNE